MFGGFKMKKLFLLFLMIFAVACSKSGSSSPCDGVKCSGHGVCDDSSGRAVCKCDDGFVNVGNNECKLADIVDDCSGKKCEEWENLINCECIAKEGRCSKNEDCHSNKCNMETHTCEYTGPCEGVTCNNHGECREGSGYGSGYGSGSGYQSGGIYCDCENGYRPETVGDTPTCINENCLLECGENSFCDIDGDGNEYCKCIDGFDKNENDECVAGSQPEPCDLECGLGNCKFEDDAKTEKFCECPEGYVNEDGDEKKPCIEDKCKNVKCEDWQECKPSDGSCIVVYPNCNGDTDCESGEVCDLAEHECVEDVCKNVNCGNGGICTVESGNAVCNCPHGYYDNNTKCVEITSQHPDWVGVQWPFTITKSVGDDPDKVYGQIWIDGQTGSGVPQHTEWKAQLLYKKGTESAEYPVIAGTWNKIDAPFNSEHSGDNNHEYMVDFPTDKAGEFIYIFRFSLDGGTSWWYGDKGVAENVEPGPAFIKSATNYPGKATIICTDDCGDGDGLLTLESHEKTADSYTFKLKYLGTKPINFAESEITLNGKSVDATQYYDETTKTFTVTQNNLEPNKYSWLFRLVDENGDKIEPFFVPFWIGEGVDYAGFGWRDAFVYQIMTDRFLDGNPGNNVPHYDKVVEIPECNGSADKSNCDLEQWKGGDFKGIIKKIDDNYFTDMGVNALWISTPVMNEHGTSSQNEVYFTSYHAYHPVATGYNFDEDYGFGNEGIDTAFGTADEFRELVEKAHKKGIRIITDFVVNHLHANAPLYQQHHDWFYSSDTLCGPDWSNYKIRYCWFAPFLPDFDYKDSAQARKAVINHAIWLIQNFNIDGFRADALKHIDDIFVVELRTAIKDNIETTVENHNMPDEAEVFYTVGESLGGKWPRYHTNERMVQGQVNEQYYYAVKNNILQGNYSGLASTIMNPNEEASDEAFLTEKDAEEGKKGGFPGAVMGNFFGNHDQNRALSECGGDYVRFKHAQTFLLTTPINIPMLYQGDDIGMRGEKRDVTYPGNYKVTYDGGVRAVMKFAGLSSDEQAALDHVKKLGKFRKLHPALRYGKRTTCGTPTNDAWVYKLTYNGDTVIVGINKGSTYTATCSGESGTFTSFEGGTVDVQNGQVTVPAGKSLVIGK